MEAEQRVRQLRQLKRMMEMLDTEFSHRRVDHGLLADIDRMLENGLSREPRLRDLKDRLDALRESTLSPRAELHADGVRDCRRIKVAIEHLLAEVN